MNPTPDRILYAAWINSQLSIARHYGGIKLNEKDYLIEKETGDLVLAYMVKRKKKPAVVKQPQDQLL